MRAGTFQGWQISLPDHPEGPHADGGDVSGCFPSRKCRLLCLTTQKFFLKNPSHPLLFLLPAWNNRTIRNLLLPYGKAKVTD